MTAAAPPIFESHGTQVAIIAGVAMLVLLVWHRARYRHVKANTYLPAAAWTRAFVFFCACYLVSWLTGTMQALYEQPLVRPEQLADRWWMPSLIGCVVVVTIAWPGSVELPPGGCGC